MLEEIEFEDLGEVLLVRAKGELGVRGAQEFREKVKERLHQGKRGVVLDCEDLIFIDSAGFGELLVCRQQLKKTGGELRLARLKGSVASVMKTYNIGNLFQSHDTVEEALRAFD
ncbi:MAG: STAS domain-containing protein [Spirochaetes bacterium]|nr:STAS domain-containing protein [Spirochaetota bacterium]